MKLKLWHHQSYSGSVKSNKAYTNAAEIFQLSNRDSAGCLTAARLGSRQPVSPARLMLSSPRLDPFISCFQKDISFSGLVVTEDACVSAPE